MIKKFISDYAAALAFNNHTKALKVVEDAIAAGIRPEDMIASAFLTPGEMAFMARILPSRYLRSEFERGRFLLAMHENASRLPTKEFYDYALKGVQELSRSASSFMYFVSEDQSEITPAAWSGGTPGSCAEADGASLPLERAGHCAGCVRYLRPVIINDVTAVPWREGLEEELPFKRLICVPALEEGKVRLILGVGDKASDYDEYDLLQLQTAANEIHKAVRRRLAEEAEKRRTERTSRYKAALLKLIKMSLLDFEAALKQILEIDSEGLETGRVSFWTFSGDRSAIVCEDLYIRDKRSHEKGLKLAADTYPRYFQFLDEDRVIAAADARKDPRTSEFTEGYLKPLGISSMMDVPVRLQGKLVGIVCHEHTGPVREWTAEDQGFGISVADMVATLLETFERSQVEEKLRKLDAKLSAADKKLEELSAGLPAPQREALSRIRELLH